MGNIKTANLTELTALFSSSKKTGKAFVSKRDFYSLSYRYSGKVLIEENGKSMFSEKGSITFIPKGVSYTTQIVEDMNMALIHFKLDNDTDFHNSEVVEIKDASVRLLFEKVIHNFHINSPVDFHCLSAFYELIARLDDISKKESTKKIPEKIQKAKEFMEQEYSDPSVYIESVAEKFGISTSYLRREFLRGYGTTPIDFLRAVRIGNAKNLLMLEHLSVSEIAVQCGFSSDSYFIQVFRKTVGESPTKYRQRISQKIEISL